MDSADATLDIIINCPARGQAIVPAPREPGLCPSAVHGKKPPAPRLTGVAAFVSLTAAAACATQTRPAEPIRTGASAPSPASQSSVSVDATAAVGAGVPSAIASDVSFVSLEGPFWVAQGGYLLFSDVVEANAVGAHIYKFDPGLRRFSVLPYPASGPTSTNGLAMDPSGALIACERYNGRVVRVVPGRPLEVLADRWPVGTAGTGKPLSAPNDVVVRKDGNIYFTDSDWGTSPGEHAPMGVYRIAPDRTLTRVMDLEKPNGIALSREESLLYVGSDTQNKIWRLPLGADGTPGAPSLHIDGSQVAGGLEVPDGFCVDDDDNLYVTANHDRVRAIVVFNPAARPIGRIAFPANPSNCTFGGPDRRTLYVTTLHAIYEVAMGRPGRP